MVAFGFEALRIREDNESRESKSVNRSYLVNKLNYVNFQDQSISVYLKHSKYDNTIALEAKPLPCAGERLDCSWLQVPGLQQVLSSYSFAYLLLKEGNMFLMISPKVIEMSEEGVSFLLPLKGREFKVRQIKRHPSSGIGVQITQDGALFQGTLSDFTPVSLRVEGNVATPQTFKWIDPQAPVNLHLYQGKTILYSGPCGVIRHGFAEKEGTFVLSVLEDAIKRYNPARYGNTQQLVPSPNMVFKHPLIGKTVNLKVISVSGCAFCVEESEENSVLMTGMVIPSLRLSFGHALNFSCRGQVVSRSVTRTEEGEGSVNCTVVILDMDIHEHVKLLSILHQVSNQNSYFCSSVDMDALWDFFFETGFIYPEKYAHFQANKEVIKKTYQRLYGNNPHIARHFIYQEKGEILGHVAMVRFYENAWMIHHHAARKKVSLKAGITVLQQISHYLNVLRHFYFAHLNYVYCYYRPENKFPNRVFGGLARQLENQKACSLDSFAYCHYDKKKPHQPLTPPWTMKEACPFDLSELGSFYGYKSGGLMIDAFGLHPEKCGVDKLGAEYRRLGFKKEKRVYSLHHEGTLKALVITNSTDAGFNMANLTNCVKIIILDDTLPVEVMDAALAQAATEYEEEEIPVLVYPFSYVENSGYRFEKTYMLWILDLRYSDAYFEFCDTLFRGGKTVHDTA